MKTQIAKYCKEVGLTSVILFLLLSGCSSSQPSPEQRAVSAANRADQAAARAQSASQTAQQAAASAQAAAGRVAQAASDAKAAADRAEAIAARTMASVPAHRARRVGRRHKK